MKKLSEYLIPIFIMLGLFYIAGCLMESTFSISEMNETTKRILFGIWLVVSGSYSLAKVLIDNKEN